MGSLTARSLKDIIIDIFLQAEEEVEVTQMHIIIPETHPCGRDVENFIESLDDLQQLELADKLEDYEKFSLFDLLKTEKLKKIRGQLYELRVPISKANLRFWAAICSGNVLLIDVFTKKKQRLSSKEIENGLRKVRAFDCRY